MPLLRSEPEEVNVASGVVAMGRSGLAAAACAQAECLRYIVRKLPSMHENPREKIEVEA